MDDLNDEARSALKAKKILVVDRVKAEFAVSGAKVWEFVTNWRGMDNMAENKNMCDLTPAFFNSVLAQVKVQLPPPICSHLR